MSRHLLRPLRPSVSPLIAAAATVLCGLAGASAQANELFFNLNKNYTEGTPSLFLFGDAGTSVSVSNGNSFSQSFSLDSTGFFNLALPPVQSTAGTGISDKGFVVSSSGSIGAYLVNRAPYTSDMAYLYDSKGLGTQYLLASQGGGNGEGSQVGITATQDNTIVTLTPKSGAAVTVTLNKGQTYTYAGGSVDLTGSRVSANKPIAVLSGHQCANVPIGTGYCDTLVEQMPSIDRLSKRYVVSETTNTGSAGNLVRVISPTDGNQIKVGGVVVATLNAGQVHEFTLQDAAVIEGSAPVMVAQYLKGQDATFPDVSDPSMAVIGGSDTWLDAYRLATPTGKQAFAFNYANIVIDASAEDSLQLNGADVDTSSFADVAGTTLRFGSIRVSGLFSLNAKQKFQLVLAGFDSYDTYMTTGGTSFAPGASPTPQVPEPSDYALLASGLVTLLIARRRLH
ncbi:hypothetical protein [Aquabacterium sp.]|uniref:IgGFc-binding protein n=1 Tax=Aquabacterium sp. TaxID=1872578 RepID=UPI0025C2CACB|nr:hypothetical protein [Aquabacterium sp.]